MTPKTLLTAVAAFGLAAASAQAQDTLRIGTEGAYPPWNLTNAAGELEGFEIDLGQALCGKLAMTCEFVAQDWDGIIPALEGGRYDAIMAGMSITDERKERIAFSQGYVTEPAWLIAPADSELQQAETIDDVRTALEGKSVGVQTATIHQNFIEQEIPGADVQLYDTQENMQLDLTSGRLDAALADSAAWEAFIATPEGANFEQFGPNLTGAEFPVFGEGVGIGMRKDDAELLERVNQALCELKADGTVAELSTKWFGKDITMTPPEGLCAS